MFIAPGLLHLHALIELLNIKNVGAPFLFDSNFHKTANFQSLHSWFLAKKNEVNLKIK